MEFKADSITNRLAECLEFYTHTVTAEGQGRMRVLVEG